MINRIDTLTESFLTTMNTLLSKVPSFTYPMEPEAIHYLNFDGHHHLLSICAVIPIDEFSIECIGFTHPDYRHQGYFKALLDEISLDWEDYDIIFSISTPCDDTKKTLEALCVEHIGTDYFMKYTFQHGLNFSTDFPKELMLMDRQKHEGMVSWNLLLNSIEIGHCKTSFLSGKKCCLHHVEILESYRNLGYGTYLLQMLLSALKTQGITQVILHVEDSNMSAVSLYKKTGFLITETLSSYLY